MAQFSEFEAALLSARLEALTDFIKQQNKEYAVFSGIDLALKLTTDRQADNYRQRYSDSSAGSLSAKAGKMDCEVEAVADTELTAYEAIAAIYAYSRNTRDSVAADSHSSPVALTDSHQKNVLDDRSAVPNADVGCSSTSSELVRSFKSFALTSLALGDCDDDILERKTSLADVDKDHRDDSSTKTKQAWNWDILPPLPEFEPIDLDKAVTNESAELELSHRSNISKVSSKSTLPTPPIAYHDDAENITPRSATRTKALTVRRQLNTNFAPVREDYNSTHGQMRLQEQTADQTEYRRLLADGALLLQSSDLSISVLNNWYEVTAELNRRLGSGEEPLLHPLWENTATPASAWTIDSEEFDDAGEGLTEDEDFVQFWLDNRLDEEEQGPDTLTPLASSSSEDTFSKRRLNRSSGTKETSIVPAMSTMTAKIANRSQAASSDKNDDSALRITLASDPASTTALAPASTVRPQLRHVTPIRNGDENDSSDACDSLTFFPTVSNAPVDYDLESARSHRKWWGRLPTRTQHRSRVPFISKRSHPVKSTLGNASPSNPSMTAHKTKSSTQKVLLSPSSEDYRRRYAATRARIRAERDERRNQSRFASLLRRMSLKTK